MTYNWESNNVSVWSRKPPAAKLGMHPPARDMLIPPAHTANAPLIALNNNENDRRFQTFSRGRICIKVKSPGVYTHNTLREIRKVLFCLFSFHRLIVRDADFPMRRRSISWARGRLCYKIISVRPADDIYSISAPQQNSMNAGSFFACSAERSEHSIRNDCDPLFCSHHCWWCGKSANHGAVLCWTLRTLDAASPQCAPRAGFLLLKFGWTPPVCGIPPVPELYLEPGLQGFLMSASNETSRGETFDGYLMFILSKLDF